MEGKKGFQKGHKINVGRKCKNSTKKKLKLSMIQAENVYKQGHVPYNKGLPKHMQPRFNVSLSLKSRKKLSKKMMNGKIIHHLDHDRQNSNPDNIYIFKSQKEHMSYHKFKRNLVKQYLLNQ